MSIDDLVGFMLQEEAHLQQEHVRMDSIFVQQSTTALTVNRSNSRKLNSVTG